MEDQDSPKYFIDLDWYRNNGRIFATLLHSRISLLDRKPRERKPKGNDEKTMLKSFRKLASTNPDFIPPDLPITEAIFRVFLTEGNRPMTLTELKKRLMAWWKDVGTYKDLEPSSLKRLLDSDGYYGFQQAPTED